jgi:glycosyltransferase involved in cell wall biosynthesis
MAHALPVVVADVAENVEAMGESGLAVPYGDEEALVAALRWLVENEDEPHRSANERGAESRRASPLRA